jgi:hypothetical protein
MIRPLKKYHPHKFRHRKEIVHDDHSMLQKKARKEHWNLGEPPDKVSGKRQ